MLRHQGLEHAAQARSAAAFRESRQGFEFGLAALHQSR